MAIEIRPATRADAACLLALHLAAAAGASGLAREPDEIDLAYIEAFLDKAAIALGAFEDGVLAGEIHVMRMGPRQFQHVLTELTVAVHPAFQGRGVGVQLFEALFAEAARLTPKIERIELMVREGHAHARRLYERLGFQVEGRFPRRVRLADGTVETDLAMGKFLTA